MSLNFIRFVSWGELRLPCLTKDGSLTAAFSRGARRFSCSVAAATYVKVPCLISDVSFCLQLPTNAHTNVRVCAPAEAHPLSKEDVGQEQGRWCRAAHASSAPVVVGATTTAPGQLLQGQLGLTRETLRPF